MLNRAYVLVILLLSGCATVPPVADPAVAQRLEDVIAKRGTADCVVASYKVIGNAIPMATLSYAAQSHATSKVAPLAGIRYVAQCTTGEVYFVEIPDAPDYPVWVMQCQNRWLALHGGGCSTRSDK